MSAAEPYPFADQPVTQQQGKPAASPPTYIQHGRTILRLTTTHSSEGERSLWSTRTTRTRRRIHVGQDARRLLDRWGIRVEKLAEKFPCTFVHSDVRLSNKSTLSPLVGVGISTQGLTHGSEINRSTHEHTFSPARLTLPVTSRPPSLPRSACPSETDVLFAPRYVRRSSHLDLFPPLSFLAIL